MITKSRVAESSPGGRGLALGPSRGKLEKGRGTDLGPVGAAGEMPKVRDETQLRSHQRPARVSLAAAVQLSV